MLFINICYEINIFAKHADKVINTAEADHSRTGGSEMRIISDPGRVKDGWAASDNAPARKGLDASETEAGTAAPRTESSAQSSADSSGVDSVSISAEARALSATGKPEAASGATAAGADEPSPATPEGATPAGEAPLVPEGARVTTVVNATTAAGNSVTIDKIVTTGEGGQESFYYRASVRNGDQEATSFLLDRNTILSDQPDGTVSAREYALGEETSGNDIIIGVLGSTLNGGDGDDTLISLDTATFSGNVADHGHGETVLVGGDGDDRIYIDPSMSKVTVDAGDGDDLVDARGGALVDSVIRTGDGDDTVRLWNTVSTSIETGDGDDHVRIGSGTLGGDIDTGDGDDLLEAGTDIADGGFMGTDIRTGDGNDTVRAHGFVGGELDTGDGDDTVSLDFSVYGRMRTGSGNDSVQAREFTWSSMDMGDGDDTFRFDTANYSRIRMGNGDDVVSAGSLVHSELDAGDGDDRMTFRNFVENATIRAGQGDDVFLANGDLFRTVLDMGQGEDEMHIHGRRVESEIATDGEADEEGAGRFGIGAVFPSFGFTPYFHGETAGEVGAATASDAASDTASDASGDTGAAVDAQAD